MKKLFILLLFAFYLTAAAQSNIVATGGVSDGNDGSTVSYSVGQIDFTTIESTQGSMSLGNQQPYEIFVLEVIENEIGINYTLYPNPTANNVSLTISNFENNSIQYSLCDTTGKLLIANSRITSETSSIPLENLASSIYYLTVFDQKMKPLKTFKIIKN